MCVLKMPIFKPLSWVIEGVDGLDYELTKPQKANLIMLLTAMFLLSTLTLSSASIGWMGIISVNALSHFMSYAGLDGHRLMTSAVRFAVRVMHLKGVFIKLAIDDNGASLSLL